MMHRLLLPLVFAVLALVSSVQAEELRYYDIEVIIFESLDPSARQSENWKTDISRQIPEVAAELDQPYPGAIPPQYDPRLTFKSLPTSQYQLQNEEKLLTATRQYRVLLHTAWRQPGMSAAMALPVHLHRSYLSEAPVSHSLLPSNPDMPASNQPTAPSQSRSTLDGYIKIILSRYLHAEVDLVYTTGLPLTPQTVTTTPDMTPPLIQPVIYHLKESRRMRSKELHYLDHPVLGVLLMATPYEGKPHRPVRKSR